jgi:quinol monooxygenase YgiN
MRELSITAKCSIHEGKLEDFRRIGQDCIDIVRANEPGTLRYDWFIDESRMECRILEKYESSEALMAHAGNLGDKLGELTGCCDVSLEIYGAPSDQVREAFGPLISGTYSFYSGA